MPEIKLKETCGCGASFDFDGSLPYADLSSLAAYWLQEHRCKPVTAVPTGTASQPATTAEVEDWRLKKVGQPCGVCNEVLTDPATLTTLNGRPYHFACKRCSVCDQSTGGQLSWHDQTTVKGLTLSPFGLIHGKCARYLKREQELAQERLMEQAGNLVVLDKILGLFIISDGVINRRNHTLIDCEVSGCGWSLGVPSDEEYRQEMLDHMKDAHGDILRGILNAPDVAIQGEEGGE